MKRQGKKYEKILPDLPGVVDNSIFIYHVSSRSIPAAESVISCSKKVFNEY